MQTELAFENAKPCEMTVAGADLKATVAQIESQGGVVFSIETPPGQNGTWKLRISWNRGEKYGAWRRP
jgi:hypothetical protein